MSDAKRDRPKEFWIDLDPEENGDRVYTEENHAPYNAVHVIEYYAYLKVKEQLAIAKEVLHKIMMESLSDGTQQLPPNIQSQMAYEALARIEKVSEGVI